MGTRSAGAVAPECGSGAGPGRSSRGRRGAGGRGVALSRSELGPVRGPGCPASRVRGKRAPRRGVPGRGTSLLRTGPHPGSLPKAEAQTFARLRGNSEPPRALPLPPPWVFTPPSGCSAPHLPPSPCARMRVCVCERAHARQGRGLRSSASCWPHHCPCHPRGTSGGSPDSQHGLGGCRRGRETLGDEGTPRGSSFL